MKHAVALWFAGHHGLFANGLSDSEMAFLTRLAESKYYSSDPSRTPLDYFTSTSSPSKPNITQYQGMVLNKVIPPKSAALSLVEEAIEEKSPAFALLVQENSIHRRAVNYDEDLEPQFNRRILGPDLPPSRMGHLLTEIDKALHSLNPYKNWLRRMLDPVSEQNLAAVIKECRLALSKMQRIAYNLQAILSKNRFPYPAEASSAAPRMATKLYTLPPARSLPQSPGLPLKSDTPLLRAPARPSPTKNRVAYRLHHSCGNA